MRMRWVQPQRSSLFFDFDQKSARRDTAETPDCLPIDDSPVANRITPHRPRMN